MVQWDVRRVRVDSFSEAPKTNPGSGSLHAIFLSYEQVRFPCWLRSILWHLACWIPSISHKVLIVLKPSWVVGGPRPCKIERFGVRRPVSIDWCKWTIVWPDLTEYTITWQQWQKCRAPNCCSLVNYLVGRRKQLPLSWESKRPTPWMPPRQEIKASTRPLLRNHSGLHTSLWLAIWGKRGIGALRFPL